MQNSYFIISSDDIANIPSDEIDNIIAMCMSGTVMIT